MLVSSFLLLFFALPIQLQAWSFSNVGFFFRSFFGWVHSAFGWGRSACGWDPSTFGSGRCSPTIGWGRSTLGWDCYNTFGWDRSTFGWGRSAFGWGRSAFCWGRLPTTTSEAGPVRPTPPDALVPTARGRITRRTTTAPEAATDLLVVLVPLPGDPPRPPRAASAYTLLLAYAWPGSPVATN